MTALSDKGTPQLPKSLTVHPIHPVSGVKDVAEAAMAAPAPPKDSLAHWGAAAGRSAGAAAPHMPCTEMWECSQVTRVVVTEPKSLLTAAPPSCVR